MGDSLSYLDNLLPWYMSHYTMPYKYGKRTSEFLRAFLFPFQSSFPRF